MKKFILCFAILLLFGCEKEDDSLSCEKNDTGELQIINSSNDSYDIYIDGIYERTLYENSYFKVDLKSGFHLVKYVQADGYLLFPTEKEYTGTLVQCGEMVFTN
jgi:hypothetical protein